MPVYLLTATDQHGKRDTHRVTADSAQQACNEFEENGYSDIVLHSDDVFAATTDLFPANDDVEEHLTAADLVQMQHLSDFQQFLFTLRRAYWQSRWFYLLVILAFVYRWHYQLGWFGNVEELDAIDLGLLVVVLLPLVITLWYTYLSPARKYKQLMQAFAWGLWDEVIDLCPTLRGKIPGFELACRHAVALAAEGKFEEGMDMIEQFEEIQDIPRWMYLGRLSELYEVVKDGEQVIECHRLSYEAAPDNPTVQLDYAYALLKYQQNLPLAQQLMAEAEQQHLSELLKFMLPYLKGILALNQGRPNEAEKLFHECQSLLLPISHSEPMLQLFVDFNRGFLAIALAELGDPREAEKLYQLVEPRLKATDSTLIMERYAAAMAR
ncbi:tetratricopeptide repeat protein [Gimesia panareensis]|uniref:Uncharacterized protein n=1 Tax=Gimesia panareensis TaxID=2527978 RepID=A0A518AAX7_9PLAN|nr:hypothetical protein [Gimesia panareensis]QDT29021.1 hypothetical protein Enr10x_43700 [Gimesia panareensis]QDU51873.1 hypothetical protein Pan110_42430 [Gimesia panareensis]